MRIVRDSIGPKIYTNLHVFCTSYGMHVLCPCAFFEFSLVKTPVCDVNFTIVACWFLFLVSCVLVSNFNLGSFTGVRSDYCMQGLGEGW